LKASRHPVTAVVAAVLSFLAPGTGHLYLGRAKRFMIPLSAFAVAVAGFGVAGVVSNLFGFTFLMAMGLGVALFGIVDSFVQGLSFGRSERKWYGPWLVIIAWWLALAGLALAWPQMRSLLGYDIYRIPAPSMMPTLQLGDVILVDSRLSPQQQISPGSLVIVRHPRYGLLYARRVGATSGPDAFALTSDWTWAARDPELQIVPRSAIVGFVTAVLWSPQRHELGLIPK
jgi:hypothetical protein